MHLYLHTETFRQIAEYGIRFGAARFNKKWLRNLVEETEEQIMKIKCELLY